MITTRYVTDLDLRVSTFNIKFKLPRNQKPWCEISSI
jgi:hypothetical protein